MRSTDGPGVEGAPAADWGVGPALARIRALLDAHAGEVEAPPPPARRAAPALRALAEAFGLSGFEEDLVALAAAVELDGPVARRVAELLGHPGALPTFDLAFELLPGPEWSALAPQGSLRRNRLVRLEGDGPLVARRIRLTESVLHFLVGHPQLEPGLADLVQVRQPEALSEAAQATAEAAAGALGAARRVVLTGARREALVGVAAQVAAQQGLVAYLLDARGVPVALELAAELAAGLGRDLRLVGGLLVVDAHDVERDEQREAARWLLERLEGPAALLERHPSTLAGAEAPHHDVPRASLEVRAAAWVAALGGLEAPAGLADRLAGSFDLGPEAIARVARQAAAEGLEGAPEATLWRACRRAARRRVGPLVELSSPQGALEDLVLPPLQQEALRSIVAHVRQRVQVYHRWGFAQRHTRGLGITALFHGPSGTGKTRAAEVVAGMLGLELMRVDLSQVVSKYIGETEKNLRRVFDAADAGGAVLLFDEADALFGKRSEVKDSHDRYANIEVGYLLQRMEAYEGLAILTTNQRRALDEAFLRRIRFYVEFPFPDPGLRRALWDRVFPSELPTEGLDLGRLAGLELTGGHIYNIALGAAVLAADEGRPLGMEHVARAARAEHDKLDRPFSDRTLGVM
jgi:hypothetical protein